MHTGTEMTEKEIFSLLVFEGIPTTKEFLNSDYKKFLLPKPSVSPSLGAPKDAAAENGCTSSVSARGQSCTAHSQVALEAGGQGRLGRAMY